MRYFKIVLIFIWKIKHVNDNGISPANCLYMKHTDLPIFWGRNSPLPLSTTCSDVLCYPIMKTWCKHYQNCQHWFKVYHKIEQDTDSKNHLYLFQSFLIFKHPILLNSINIIAGYLNVNLFTSIRNYFFKLALWLGFLS